jgi:DNA-binding NtrC family response regulator
MVMNQYGRRAMKHWQEWLPGKLAELEDAEEFFAAMGEQATEEIDELAAELDAQYPDRDQAPEAERVAQLSTARRQAENQVTRDLLLVDPQDEDKIAQLMG